MFRNQCFHYYCLDLENREVFYRWIEAIFEILKVFNDNGLIAFAFHENERLLLHKFYNILEIKRGNLSNYSFIPNLLVVNLQESKYESLTEALYSLGYLSSGDSLFRNNKLIPELAGRLAEFPDLINLILAHNRNCLCNENIILLKRFLPKYCLTVRD